MLFPFAPGILRGIARYSRLNGPWEFYRPVPYYRERVSRQKSLQRMREYHADGIIAHVHSEKEARELIPEGTPAVVSHHCGKAIEGMASIVGDDVQTGRIAAEYLLNRGFRRFAYCGFADELYWSRDRREGFVRRLARGGFQAYVYKQPQPAVKRLWENEQNIMADWLRLLPKPIGLLACNDDRGREVIDACRIAGIYVPEEIAVLGVGNDEMVCQLYDPPMSSIITNSEMAGYEAAELLARLMAGNKLSNQKIVIHPTHVITRRSTDILAIEDREVAEAMRFIQQHSKEAIQVRDVVDSVAVSRRALERRFSAVLNRSINEEIRRIRTETICRMLKETNLSVSQIASALGFVSLDHISRFFRTKMGLSPLAYRKKVLGNGK